LAITAWVQKYLKGWQIEKAKITGNQALKDNNHASASDYATITWNFEDLIVEE
jgi:hypothetical protein